MAKGFQDRYQVPFPVLVDTSRATYAALGLGRLSIWDVLCSTLREILRGRGLVKVAHYGVGAPKKNQDVFQLGGALVVARGGAVRFVYRAQDFTDVVPVDALLGALP